MLAELHEKIRKNKEDTMTKEMMEIIQYHIDNKMIMNIERKNISKGERITGFPVVLTDDYLLMTNIYDFHDEGYVLVKVCDITDAYSKDVESFYESICIKEKLQEKISKCPVDDVKDVKSFIEIISQKRYITLHCEKETKKCNFFLGKVMSVKNNFIEFISLGVDGKWNDKTDIIYLSDITMITFDDYYAKTYYKYVEER